MAEEGAPDGATPPAAGSGARPRPRGRLLLLAALVVSWLISVPFMWKSVTTVPSAQRLQAMQSRIMHVPSPATFLKLTGQSFVELAAVVALLWPWWRRFWLARLVLALLGLFAWAVLTLPLELTDLEWVHHRWLVGADVLVLIALGATVVTRLVGAVRRVGGRSAP